MDAQFVTTAISKDLDANKIELHQPAPYEHGQNGNGESIVKIIQDGVNKLLYRIGKHVPQYKALWGLAAMEVT